MKLLVTLALAASAPAWAAMGVLVGQSSQIVGGEYYTVCTYDVAGTRIDRLLKGAQMCPLSIQM